MADISVSKPRQTYSAETPSASLTAEEQFHNFLELWRAQIAIIRRQTEEGEFAWISGCVDEIREGLESLSLYDSLRKLREFARLELANTSGILDCSSERVRDYETLRLCLRSWEHCVDNLESLDSEGMSEGSH